MLYIYLRTQLHIPLPALSTLRRWLSQSFTCNAGLQIDILKLMEKQEKSTSESQLCVISFDEMNIDSRRCYDEKEDKILGPHSQVQVVMCRSLCKSWKQPVYYQFDEQMRGRILLHIITAVQKAGYIVVAVVSDLGGKNSTVWKDPNVTYLNSCFENPDLKNKRIWVFADMPHLIKLLRNHYIDHGFTLDNGTKITKTTIETLLEMDKNETKICHHLPPNVLQVSGRERQRVHMATKLFSRRTAKAIEYLFPEEKCVSEFFQLVNDTFDIFNSRIPINNNSPLASAYGIHHIVQEETIEKFYKCL